MQNDPFSQNSGSLAEAAPGGAKDSASRREWTEFERDLDALGRQLSELRGHSRSGPGRNHESREDGTKFPYHTEGDHGTDHALGAEQLKPVVPLESHYHSSKGAG